MPHLQFEINAQLNSSQKKTFNKIILSEFSRIMKTGTDHIAISIREFSQQSLTLGRAEENDIVCLMNLDIRSGRTNKQKKQLIESYTNAVSEIFGVKKKNQYITFSEHPGIDFNFYEKSLQNWIENDNPGED
tara:strand:+ start:2222 stop:2617 length:396 start_codon:yes stop_codon:yes gene_type:complete